ncbi:MAG TPA: metallophosphoesterase [Pirellulales bacterium]|nr:metallophosphoesterase [Pirellulales bacterium]
MVATFDYIEGVISTFQKAAEANEDTPTREGNVVVLSAEVADDVMITADLHGHRKNFNSIKKIADLARHPRRHLILQEVCHGGPTYSSNGGCMSHGMLEDVARLKAAFPDRVHFLLSNHELAELTDYPILKAKKMLNLMFRLGLQEMYGPATEKVREAYTAFIRSCPLAVRLPGGVLVCHTLPERCDSRGFDRDIFERPLEAPELLEHGDVFNLLWGRDYRAENAKAFAKQAGASVLIHGHEPCPEGFNVPNDVQIILDCCGQPACYLIVPTDREYSHADLVGRIQRLP